MNFWKNNHSTRKFAPMPPTASRKTQPAGILRVEESIGN
jgi:hypothetical protein